MFVGILTSMAIYGITTLQVSRSNRPFTPPTNLFQVYYYFSSYPRDSLGTKILVSNLAPSSRTPYTHLQQTGSRDMVRRVS